MELRITRNEKMTITICEINVSIPNGISDLVHQSDDNKTEFDGMRYNNCIKLSKLI